MPASSLTRDRRRHDQSVARMAVDYREPFPICRAFYDGRDSIIRYLASSQQRLGETCSAAPAAISRGLLLALILSLPIQLASRAAQPSFSPVLGLGVAIGPSSISGDAEGRIKPLPATCWPSSLPLILCTKWTCMQARQVTPSYSSVLGTDVPSDTQT